MRTLLASLVLLAACGPSGRGDDGGGDDDPQVRPDSNNNNNPDSPPTPGVSRVYAHTADTLYRVDSVTLTPNLIGVMSGLDGPLLDLAVDKDDKIVGSTAQSLYQINSTTAAATKIASLTGNAQGMSSLSYVPDPQGGDDILVSANNNGDVYRIALPSGAASPFGNYGTGSGTPPNYTGNQKITSSGDIFGVKDFGTYATVKIAGQTEDFLAVLNPATWKADIIGPIGYSKVFGIGFWGGTIFGFVDTNTGGVMINIDPQTGAGTEVNSGPERWYGAGVTTLAPIIQ